eukprot:TRINITY_DN73537_c0_g1_i1.p1 TRINITY_DN73537_c0_g1~~TRINITY_DN73537_c0_g1_i1.p1  ORF type:complete len:643 (+),score=43.34 TRINITY_DN73537_c0_g1_i1:239-1930(+)
MMSVFVQVSPLVFVPLEPTCEYGLELLTCQATVQLTVPFHLCMAFLLAGMLAVSRLSSSDSRAQSVTNVCTMIAVVESWARSCQLWYRCSSGFPTTAFETAFGQGAECAKGVHLMCLLVIVKREVRILSDVAPVLTQMNAVVNGVVVIGWVLLPLFVVLNGINSLWLGLVPGVFYRIEGFLLLACAPLFFLLFSFFGWKLMGVASAARKEASETDIRTSESRVLLDATTWVRHAAIAIVATSATLSLCFIATGLIFFWDSFVLQFVRNYIIAVDTIVRAGGCVILLGLSRSERGVRTDRLRVATTLVMNQRRREIDRRLREIAGESAGSALTIACLMSGACPHDVHEDAASRFRSISWDVLEQRPDILMDATPLDGNALVQDDLYSLSEPCELGQCDAFVSHSWRDDAILKWGALRSWCEDFLQSEGRYPRLWLDKVCVDQKNISSDLRCLPIFIAGCNALLVTSGLSYPFRLWCSFELLVHSIMIKADPDRIPLQVCLLGDIDDQLRAWRNYRVQDCDCFDPRDKERFLHIVSLYPGGAECLNDFVRTHTSVFKDYQAFCLI